MDLNPLSPPPPGLVEPFGCYPVVILMHSGSGDGFPSSADLAVRFHPKMSVPHGFDNTFPNSPF